MKEKIINIKDILKIVIIVLIIFSAIKSCSRADTISNLIADFTTLNEKGKISDNFLNNVTYWANHYLSPNENRPYLIGFTTSSSEVLPNSSIVMIFNASATSVINATTTPYSWQSVPYRTINIYYNNLEWSNSTSNTNPGGRDPNKFTWEYAYTTIEINTTSLKLNAGEEYGGSYLTASFTFTPIKDEVVTIDNISGINAKKNIYQYADVTLGKVDEYLEENRFTLMELTQDNNLIAYVKYNNLSKQVINSSYMGIEIADNASPPYDLIRVNNWRLYLNQIYTLNIYNGNENVSNTSYSDKQTFNYIFLKSNAIISNGVITNYGSGDGFTNQDSTNAIIDNSNQNNGFWENAYNNLFVVSGDYIENKLNEVKNNLGFSGDYEEEKAFINLINEQNGDFIISWNNYTPHFSLKGQQINNVQMISGDSINFSQLERENEEFHEVMTWTRTLIGFSLGYCLIHNYWTTLLHTLGVRRTSI